MKTEKETLNTLHDTHSSEHEPAPPRVVPEVPNNESALLLTSAPFYKRKKFLVGLLIVIVVSVGGGYYAYTKDVFSKSVAVVNGVKITQVEFDKSVALIEEGAVLQGINLADIGTKDLIKQQALDILINNTLLLSAAKDAEIEVTSDEIDERYIEIVATLGNDEVLISKLEELGLTESDLKSDIGEKMLADKYIESVTDIENVQISDEEINKFYATLSENTTSIPPLDEIKDQIALQLGAQKQQQIFIDVLEQLRNEAEITINI